jgi:hypothetical protein
LKQLRVFFLLLLCILPLAVYAEKEYTRGSGGRGSHRPVVINIDHSSSGGHNRNFPSQQPPAEQQMIHQPSYGQVHWKTEGQNNSQPAPQNRAQRLKGSGSNLAAVFHRQPYTQGDIQKKLKEIGVTAEPSYITDRAQIIHTDAGHSAIRLPEKGINNENISAAAVDSRHFNEPAVRNQMAVISSSEWIDKVRSLNRSENSTDQHYWHKENGFDYCHYKDHYGYHWYGWYIGNQYFWNRYYRGRWWWYDSDSNRWCFWNNNFWWWQDPHHIGDLYCYNDYVYIPCNSAEDEIVVTVPDNPSQTVYTSPDGSRAVKIDKETEDAFLFDVSNKADFGPVYLASGVTSVQFSDPRNGKPMEIMLKLNDGSFDMFDGQGNAYTPDKKETDSQN